MSKIKAIKAIEILDSRGNPTLQTEVFLESGVRVKAAVPSGASTGKYEAFELRDGEGKRYAGLGVKKAVANVNKKIAPLLKGFNPEKQAEIDQKMIALDNTENKKYLGANAILSVSLATCRAAAFAQKKPLYEHIAGTYGFKKPNNFPVPMMNIFNGGKHADTNLDFQEFMIVPVMDREISEKIRAGAEIFHALGEILGEKGYDTDVGNEGGYAPDIDHSMDALEMIVQAIERAGYEPGREVALACDVGAATLYDKRTKKYYFKQN